ncbi:MAG: glycoside hydrolase family 2 [Prevotellaceae bacterium]|jgi:beta-galactosidase|nr:glycoside hydrolase family 2 [Prevotellaceae bacterium]
MKFLKFLVAAAMAAALPAAAQKTFSAAGFYELSGSGRETYSFNAGWRYFKGDAADAAQADFNDESWEVVCLPHTVELAPAEASGGRTYQGVAWYRKHFTLGKDLEGKKVSLYFEAVMGRCKVYVNGKPVREHLGGYLPFCIDLTGLGVAAGERCVVAVMADNSNDKTYPPGKPQYALDFTYHGGIYRDVYLAATSPLHITDPNHADRVAGGGVFVQYGDVTRRQAAVSVATDVVNEDSRPQRFTVETLLRDENGAVAAKAATTISLKAGEQRQVRQAISLKNPRLWLPEAPYLYSLQSSIVAGGKAVDGVVTRVGVRKVEMRGRDGLYINGEPYAEKLIGVNRHQDYAYVGNAMPNSQHWRDAKKLKEAGVNVIRVAHYPQDPSFMDACDELGMFVIVATPGWQFWPKGDTVFPQRVYADIRSMVRRDRNHPCLLMWEPILNETQFPLDFSLKALQAVREEQPGCFSAADLKSSGVRDNYDVIYGWPKDTAETDKPVFTREFGDNPDDWYAHNAIHRASRSWGERPQVLQALHLAKSYGEMCGAPRQFLGGAMWHSFDHQRGYHPDPFWGGFMDAFRQPKYSYYAYKSQQKEPMVFIAHEITPFSDADVTVFAGGCDSVRLIRYGRDTLTQKVERHPNGGIPNPPVVFRDAYNFYDMRLIPYVRKKWEEVYFIAEGIAGGKVVAREKKMPSRRSTRLQLRLDNEGQPLTADGADFIPVIAEVIDDLGNVRRLAKEDILFSVEGEGEIIGGSSIGANPRAVEFGSAPVLVRSTLTPGKITLTARALLEGENTPKPAAIAWESVAPKMKAVYSETPGKRTAAAARSGEAGGGAPRRQLTDEERQRALLEVERQQTTFGEKFVK